MRSPPLGRKTTCEKHDLVQSGKSSLTSWPDVKLIPQTNKQISKISSNENCSEAFLKHKEKKEEENVEFTSDNREIYNNTFSLEELKHALHQSKPSSPGPDTVHYDMLKNLPKEQLELLLHVFNNIWIGEQYPSSWSEATVIPILKSGKDDSNPSSYRPIAMTSCLAKTMERMVNNRLTWYLESNNLLNPYQSGFRQGRSTTDHLVRLESYIKEGFAQKEHVLGVFFDLEKAYDTTWKHGILRNIHEMGLRGRLPTFIEKFLANRTFSVRLGTALSERVDQEMGVPQGCVLSVTLFGIQINNITKHLRNDLDFCLYVDDFVMCYRSRLMATTERKLQQAMNTLETWSTENGFRFSQNKTTCVHFCRQRGCKEKPSLFLQNAELPVKEEVKFLGMIYDRILSFKPHIEYVRRKCQKAMNLLKVLSGVEWGADREILLTIYKAYIQSRLDYGSIVYNSACKSYLDRLNPVQNQALRICLGAFRTSPTVSLHVEANVPPLNLRRKKLSLQYAIRVKADKRNPTHNTLFRGNARNPFKGNKQVTPPFSRCARTLTKEADIPLEVVKEIKPPEKLPWSQKKPLVILEMCKNKKNETNPCTFKNEYRALRDRYRDHIPIFTDGSKEGNKVGYAVHTEYGDLTGALHGRASIFTAEARALTHALDWIKVSGHRKFIIFSDSKSCLQAILQHQPTNSIIREIQQNHTDLKKVRKEVIFCWLPSHIGITGNEKADQAAKRALAQEPDVFAIPHTDLLPLSGEHIQSQWQNDWTKKKDNHLYSVQPTLEQRSDKRKRAGLTRSEQVKMARLKIGHTRLTHEHRLKGVAEPMCQECNAILTVEHILLNCKKFENSRKNHLKNITSMKNVFDNNECKTILNFLREVQLFEKI